MTTQPDREYITVAEVERLVGVLVRRELATMLQLNEPQPKLLSPSRARKALDFPSLKALADARKNGVFRLGIEVFDRSKPGSKKGVYQYDVEKCHKRIESLTKKKGSDRND